MWLSSSLYSSKLHVQIVGFRRLPFIEKLCRADVVKTFGRVNSTDRFQVNFYGRLYQALYIGVMKYMRTVNDYVAVISETRPTPRVLFLHGAYYTFTLIVNMCWFIIPRPMETADGDLLQLQAIYTSTRPKHTLS